MFNIFTAFFKKVGKLITKALGLAKDAGLDDALIELALKWVRVAETKFLDNAQKREWVVGILVSRGIPEAVARLSIELAVRLLKAELKKLESK